VGTGGQRGGPQFGCRAATYEISAVTIDVAYGRLDPRCPSVRRAPLGRHCTSSGKSVPSGWLIDTTIAIASSETWPEMNGQVITQLALAAR
jgi:hypothetical protein